MRTSIKTTFPPPVFSWSTHLPRTFQSYLLLLPHLIDSLLSFKKPLQRCSYLYTSSTMKFFTTLLFTASLATSALCGVLPPAAAADAHDTGVGLSSSKDLILPEFKPAAPLVHDQLEARQSCFGGVFPLLRINRNNRRDIQGDLDARRSIEWNPNSNVRAIIDFSSTTARNRQLRYQITNRSQIFGAAIIFSNYRDTIIGEPRETIRVPIGRATGMSLRPTPTTGAGCIVLPRLDGTWYAQLE